MNGEYVTTMGFNEARFAFEVHYFNSSNGVRDSKQFTDILTNEYIAYVAKRIQVFGYEKAIIFKRFFDGQLKEVTVIHHQPPIEKQEKAVQAVLC